MSNEQLTIGLRTPKFLKTKILDHYNNHEKNNGKILNEFIKKY